MSARPHHEVLLDHVKKIATEKTVDPEHVVANWEAHPELAREIKKVAKQVGVTTEHVKHVLHAHAHDDKHDHGTPRAPDWPTYRKHWIHGSPKAGVSPHPTCASCGSKVGPQVHHKVPFQQNRALELDYNNYITLCASIADEDGKPGRICHLDVGHAGSFHRWNPNVEADAAELLKHPERRDAIMARIKKNSKAIP